VSTSAGVPEVGASGLPPGSTVWARDRRKSQTRQAGGSCWYPFLLKAGILTSRTVSKHEPIDNLR
jgi:hypothetical protein